MDNGLIQRSGGGVLAAWSHALDLTEGVLLSHTIRTCLIGMRIYDALTTDRPYREGYSHERAMEIIVKDRETKLCERVVGVAMTMEKTV